MTDLETSTNPEDDFEVGDFTGIEVDGDVRSIGRPELEDAVRILEFAEIIDRERADELIIRIVRGGLA